MNGKELAITILGLLGTFCLPWPGESDRGEHRFGRGAALYAAACTSDCSEHEASVRAQRQQAAAARARSASQSRWNR